MSAKTGSPVRLPPQVGQDASTAALMADVMIALTPALGMAVFFFGWRTLALAGISMLSCVVFECVYRLLTRQRQAAGDLSACVTGLLLAMSLPVTAPYWVPVLGGAFAMVVVKQLYGGLGKNFINPALGGRMLLTTFPMVMTAWSRPLDRLAISGGVDAVTAATPLSYLHEGALPPLSPGQLLLGQQGGCLGEVSSFMLLLGGFYLILRRVISPRIPFSYLATVAAISYLLPKGGADPLVWMTAQLLSGGLLMGAFFFATDPVTSPVTPRGQILFGICCGALTMLLRYHSSYPEGVGWAILTMNCGVWLLDRAGMPRRFGEPPFSVLRGWLRRAWLSMAEIKFTMPVLRRTREGEMPGEAHLDLLRAQIRPLACLAAVMLVTGGAVAGVFRLTEFDTARNQVRARHQLLAQVMPQAATSSETPYQANGALSITAGYSADNQLIGYCVEVQSYGFSGVITMVVGVDLNGSVTGVAVTDHKESSGIGTEAITPAALRRYVGRSGTIRSTGPNAVDAVSGATATSKAITAGVNRALAVIANLDTEGSEFYNEDGNV